MNVTLLMDEMFIRLIDTELQTQIEMAKEWDFDVKETMTQLLGEGLTKIKKDLDDWKIEKTERW